MRLETQDRIGSQRAPNARQRRVRHPGGSDDGWAVAGLEGPFGRNHSWLGGCGLAVGRWEVSTVLAWVTRDPEASAVTAGQD